MGKYRVNVQRVIKDVQHRAVDIEAPNMEAAGQTVLNRIAMGELPDYADFWRDAKTEVYDSDPPEITSVDVLQSPYAYVGALVAHAEAIQTDNMLRAALSLIKTARDERAESAYPNFPYGPGADQSFDDWAADIAETAIAMQKSNQQRSAP